MEGKWTEMKEGLLIQATLQQFRSPFLAFSHFALLLMLPYK